jgi:glutamate-1-semialdehyde 2,1-aminomutase
MALRVARAATGKRKILKFHYHYHGWHDAVGTTVMPPWDVPYSPGIPDSVLGETLSVPCNDSGAVREVLQANSDVAAVILEPGGGDHDTVPISEAFLRELRAITTEYGVVLIFDEVVTGFRYARGGAQEYFGVMPDLTALGKVVGGGVSSGAVAGRRDLMGELAETDNSSWNRRHVVPHHGTWNANPLAAAAGVASLRLIASGEPLRVADERARQLRDGLNRVFDELGIPGLAYGKSSIWKTYLGRPPKMLSGDFSDHLVESDLLRAGWGSVERPLRKTMLLNGVDLMRSHGFLSAAHTEEDVETTIVAFRRSLTRLLDENILRLGDIASSTPPPPTAGERE